MVHKNDEKWVKEQLRLIKPQYRTQAWEGYQLVYLEAYENEPTEHKKSNAARRAANTRLREFTQKVLDTC